MIQTPQYATITNILKLPSMFDSPQTTYHFNLSGGQQANESGEYYMTLKVGDVVELEHLDGDFVVRKIVLKTPIEQFVEGCLK